MRIRKSLEEDLPRMKEIEDWAIQQYYQSGFTSDEVVARTEEDIRFLITHTQMLVAEEAGEIRGYLSYYSIGPYLHLEEHVVDKRHWRRGIGTELLNHYLQVGAEAGECQYYSLFVFPEAEWAWHCYQRSGFRTVSVEEMVDLGDENLRRMMEGEQKLRELARGRVLMIKKS